MQGAMRKFVSPERVVQTTVATRQVGNRAETYLNDGPGGVMEVPSDNLRKSRGEVCKRVLDACADVFKAA